MFDVYQGSPDENIQPSAVNSGHQGRSGKQGFQHGAGCLNENLHF